MVVSWCLLHILVSSVSFFLGIGKTKLPGYHHALQPWTLPTSRHQAIPLCHSKALRSRARDLVAGHATEGSAQGHTEPGAGGPRHLMGSMA